MEKEIIIPVGSKLDDAIKRLLDAKKRGEQVYCIFNDVELHSKDVTEDSAYKAVTGYSKKEFLIKKQEYKKEYGDKLNLEVRIEIDPGKKIADVEKILLDAKARGQEIYVVFNEKQLHSKDMNKDYVYKQLFGITKKEYEQKYNQSLNEHNENEKKDKLKKEKFKKVIKEMNNDKKQTANYQNVINGIKYIIENQNLTQEELFNGLVNLGCTFTIEDINEQFKHPLPLFDGIKTGDLCCGASTIVNTRDSEIGRAYVTENFLEKDDECSLYNYIRITTGDMNYTKEKIDELLKGDSIKK